ncbi:MAG: response regulator transcription factor [Cupriavidus sp.]|nr:MAG: response regulator transcription factor [Cupriavidus sp.]
MRILAVEDDPPLADGLKHGLRRGGHAVDVVHDGGTAIRYLEGASWDLVLLDLGLPVADGYAVLQSLRERKPRPPVIVLTARDGLSDRVRGLDAGADDYMVKPFEMDELLARIRAVARRNGVVQADRQELGPLSLDAGARRFYINEVPLSLPPREFGLLELLLRRRGQVVSKAQIQSQLSDWDSDLSDTAIEVSVHRLRKRLEGCGLQLRTLRGFGYLLDQEISNV